MGGKVVERAVAAVVVATTMHGACVDGASADAYADYLNSMSEEGTAVVTLSGEVDAEQALKDREAARAIGTERPKTDKNARVVMPQAKKDPTKMRMVYTPTEESMREASERVAKQKEERAAAKKAAAEARAQLKAEQAAKQEAVKAARRARNGGSDEADFGTTFVGAASASAVVALGLNALPGDF